MGFLGYFYALELKLQVSWFIQNVQEKNDFLFDLRKMALQTKAATPLFTHTTNRSIAFSSLSASEGSQLRNC